MADPATVEQALRPFGIAGGLAVAWLILMAWLANRDKAGRG